MKKVLLAVVASLFMVSVAWVQVETGGTPKDAQQLLKKAVAYMKEVGKEKAVKEFGDPKGKFIIKDVYISVYDLRGGVINHPFQKALIGKNFVTMKDPDGKPFMKEIKDTANAKGSGVVEYKFSHPKMKKVLPKIAYFEKVGDVILAASAYK